MASDSDSPSWIMIVLFVLIMWFGFVSLVTEGSMEPSAEWSRTEKFAMWDAVVDDPLIAWYMSGR